MYYSIGTTISFAKKKEPVEVHILAFSGTKIRFVKAIESLQNIHVNNSFAQQA